MISRATLAIPAPVESLINMLGDAGLLEISYDQRLMDASHRWLEQVAARAADAGTGYSADGGSGDKDSRRLDWDDLRLVGEALMWDDPTRCVAAYLTRLAKHPGLRMRVFGWGGGKIKLKPLRPLKGGQDELILTLRRGAPKLLDRTLPVTTADALRLIADRVFADWETANLDGPNLDGPDGAAEDTPASLSPHLATLEAVRRFIDAPEGQRSPYRPSAGEMEAMVRAVLTAYGFPENAISPVASLAGYLDKLFGDVAAYDSVADLIDAPRTDAGAAGGQRAEDETDTGPTVIDIALSSQSRSRSRPRPGLPDGALGFAAQAGDGPDSDGPGDASEPTITQASGTGSAGTDPDDQGTSGPRLVPVPLNDTLFTGFPHLNPALGAALKAANALFHAATGRNLMGRRNGRAQTEDDRFQTENPYRDLHVEFDIAWEGADGDDGRALGTLNGPFRDRFPDAAERLEVLRLEALAAVGDVIKPGPELTVLPVDTDLPIWTDFQADGQFAELVSSGTELLFGEVLKGVGVLLAVRSDLADAPDTTIGQRLQNSPVHIAGRALVQRAARRRDVLRFSGDTVSRVDGAIGSAVAAVPTVGAALAALAAMGRSNDIQEAGRALVIEALNRIGARSFDALLKQIARLPLAKAIVADVSTAIKDLSQQGWLLPIYVVERTFKEVESEVIGHMSVRASQAISQSKSRPEQEAGR